MNILDVIKDCITNPIFTKDYELEEFTIDKSSDSKSITNQSAFSNYSVFKQRNYLDNKFPSIDQGILRMYMRIWSSFIKYMANIVYEGNCFVCLDIGYIYKDRNNQGKYVYSPSPDLLEKFNCTLFTDSYNLPSVSKNVFYS